jgi:AraC family transcriptional regulator
MEHLIERAVVAIYERYSEPIHLEELARTAMLSKFHFLRVFRCVTGVTPGRFLSAVRLQEAKRLLLTTSFNVAYISAQVGYSGAGTFTRRFTESVGLSPTQYRKMSRGDPSIQIKRVTPPLMSKVCGSVSGTIDAVDEPLSSIYIGAFDSPILQGHPAASVAAADPGAFRLDSVPPGTWYIHAVARGSHIPAAPYCDQPLLVDTVGPVIVRPNRQLDLDVTVRPLDWSRPPILFALPGLDPVPSRT